MEKREDRKRVERSDKKKRVNSYLAQQVFEKLDRLSTACGRSATGLSAEMIEFCLSNEQIVNLLQDRHKDRSRFRIIPSRIDGELNFIFVEKKR